MSEFIRAQHGVRHVHGLQKSVHINYLTSFLFQVCCKPPGRDCVQRHRHGTLPYDNKLITCSATVVLR
jgi:hypothetical protein